ncbi:anaerobic magnesium-protoporphyrin IX monomethyl ester cyclase [Malonomonas rubra DSM 5091]|uniref:Anaerobic magnesium-protoporphyrin IX monomethyl ester cyclase n=1 Tax=Malonomonas rubra DSM 5091 TaxID=1122189 RepID=A0A1M6BGD4_MALRU|nr:B12-binding domain-containing radical SAM protein [Malonomonas rubra]SHI47781.1 anaerobic magnesium-protoporphyrin IX monomethyl ester cyclase [Malonomonas rubra DSM 5091]
MARERLKLCLLNMPSLRGILARMRTLLTTLHSKYIHASLALPCLAAFCGDDCGELLIREYTVHEPKESLLAKIIACNADVVAFSVYLWNRQLTLELVNCLKLIDPQLKIVLGGSEISFEPDYFFQQHPVDALICGEGELPLRQLLSAWQRGEDPQLIPGLRLPSAPQENGRSELERLAELPSPFAAGLVNLQRGLVYYESSRGCPYSCSFCMSALDDRVRSFPMPRIFSDLQFLIDAGVKQIKFVDRTFNYSNERSREIFEFILQKNRSSHFHFEIGAHLLDGKTLQLLERVPDDMFQFEIGVQSTLPETLAQIGRTASLEKLEENVRRLRQKENIHLHLDLIAGLPGEGYQHFMASLDRVAALQPHHLQVEPVKLLPGAPLRSQAAELGLKFDPLPPYSILRSPDIDYCQLEKLRGISRLLDLLVNSERFKHLLPLLIESFGGLSACLENLDSFWRSENLYDSPQALRQLAFSLDRYLQKSFSGDVLQRYREALARDYAHQERVVSGSEPSFFDCRINDLEKELVRQRVKQEVELLERSGKVQYFAGRFNSLPEAPDGCLLIFIYQTKSRKGQKVKEVMLCN